MQKIAIIGSGISGMAAAYLLHPYNNVTLYEKNSVIGGHARTKIIDYNGHNVAVDTGFIVFNHLNYPNLTALFKHLGVATQKSNMSFALTMDGGEFEWGANSINSIFATRKNIFNIQFYKMLKDIMRFFKKAHQCLNENNNQTLGQFLDELKLGIQFKEKFILPMGAAIWSSPIELMLQFPAKTFVQFFKNHGLLSINGQHQWYTVSGGSQNYINKLVDKFQNNIILENKIIKSWQDGNHILLEDMNGRREKYDQVIFACHADETLEIIQDATNIEKQILGAFHYQKNHAYLHSDSSFMPKRKACWSSWVYNLDMVNNKKQVSLTYWMNLLQNIDNKYPLFVTLNPSRKIDEGKIFDQHVFSHPVFNQNTIIAQKQLANIQGNRNIWHCGAYQNYGFHEDGLASAVKVAQLMGIKIPWQTPIL